jgi:1-acyl-sn-glycerol-3-phosphate acyltransferase
MKRTINKAVLHTFSTASKLYQKRYTDYIQVDGAQNIPQETCLWLLKHDSMRDSMYLGALWRDIPGRPPLRIATRTNHARIGPLNPIYNWLASSVTFEVHRPFIGEGASEDEIRKMREQNRLTLEEVKQSMQKGFHAAIYPEGTVMTDGRTMKVRAGCRTLAQAQLEGKYVACLATGLTYDRLTDRRDGDHERVYVNVGPAFRYAPVEPIMGETDDEYTKRDIHAFTDGVRKSFLDLTTITPAQLAGEYLITSARAGETQTSKGKIAGVLAARVHTLSALDLVMDNELRQEDSRARLTDTLFNSLIAEGYLTADGRMNNERILTAPADLDRYRSENKLLHSANRLYELAESRQDIQAALDSTRYF